MTLIEQAARRVEMAHALGQTPVRWIATANTAAGIPEATLCDLPIEIGTPRSDWGLELVMKPA